MMYLDGRFVSADNSKGWDLIHTAASKGSMVAQNYLDELTKTAEEILKEQPSESLQ